MEIKHNYLDLRIKDLSELKCFDNIPGEKLIPEIPSSSGVYILADKYNNLLYIGKAKILRSRISAHTSFNSHTNSWVDKSRVRKIYIIECPESINELVEHAYQFFYDSEFNNNGDAFECLKNAGLIINKEENIIA